MMIDTAMLCFFLTRGKVSDSLWQVIGKISGPYNIPIVVNVLAALFLRKTCFVGTISVTVCHLPV